MNFYNTSILRKSPQKRNLFRCALCVVSNEHSNKSKQVECQLMILLRIYLRNRTYRASYTWTPFPYGGRYVLVWCIFSFLSSSAKNHHHHMNMNNIKTRNDIILFLTNGLRIFNAFGNDIFFYCCCRCCAITFES